jgi:hypothetical protein
LFWVSGVPPPALHALALITPLDAAFSPLIANRGDRLVLETLEPLPGDRKCFRMINGVLAERTVKDVIPALRTTAEGLKKVLDDLVKQYKSKQDELDRWKVCGRIPSLYCCIIVSDLPHRKRTMSRLCNHESAAAPLTRVSEATRVAMLLSDNKGGMVSSLKSSGRTGYWRHPWINLMPFAYQLAVREGEAPRCPSSRRTREKNPNILAKKVCLPGKTTAQKSSLSPKR